MLSWSSLALAQTPGTLKSGFNPVLPGGFVTASAMQADGKTILATTSGTTSAYFTRLNTDGSVDTGFNVPGGLNRAVFLAAGPGGKTVAVTRTARDLSGHADYQIVRLLPDGTLDPAFAQVNFGGNAGSGEIYEFVAAVQPDEKILVGGEFRGEGSFTDKASIVRYNADGSADSGFKPSSILHFDLLNAIVPQPDGRILVAGNATDYATGSYHDRRLLFLKSDGSLDLTYNAAGATTTAYAPTLLPDGKIVYLATYTSSQPHTVPSSLGGLPRRLNADGSADTGFAPQLGTGALFTSLVVQANGQILVGGYTEDYSTSSSGTPGSVTSAGAVRLNADGSTDANFQSGSGTEDTSPVDHVYVAPDGSVVVVGRFFSFDGQDRRQVAGLYGDGGLNLPFFVGEAGLTDGVYYLAFPAGNIFGYYAFLSDPQYLYHFDLGYEYVFDAADGRGGVYLYDFASQSFFYTSPSFGFPYLYDFSLNTVLYYYPDPNHPGRYNTEGTRYFFRFDTGEIFSK